MKELYEHELYAGGLSTLRGTLFKSLIGQNSPVFPFGECLDRVWVLASNWLSLRNDGV